MKVGNQVRAIVTVDYSQGQLLQELWTVEILKIIPEHKGRFFSSPRKYIVARVGLDGPVKELYEDDFV